MGFSGGNRVPPVFAVQWRIGHGGGAVEGHGAGARGEGVGPVHHGVATEGDPGSWGIHGISMGRGHGIYF